MANTLSRMQRDGLVVGTPDPKDRRSTLLKLTPLGIERGKQSIAAGATVNALALEALTPEERPVFMEMLDRVIARLEADSPG
jgi:DNA-binding MarR family transcriptional regulator